MSSENEYTEFDFNKIEPLDENRKEFISGENAENKLSYYKRRKNNINQPASQPYLKITEDGEEKMAFKYNTRLSESTLSTIPKTSKSEDEYTVLIKISEVDITALNEKFKNDNCIYPRANVPIESYQGNRWAYETDCNKLAWQLVSLNPSLLYGKKGLIQRAVDSYRYLCKSSKGTKYYADELFTGEVNKRKKVNNSKYLGELTYKNRRCKVYFDATTDEAIDFDSIPDKFKAKYSVYCEEYDENSFNRPILEFRNENNYIGVKLAYLNLENTAFQQMVKTMGVTYTVKAAVELYKSKKGLGIVDDSEDDSLSDVLERALDDYEGTEKDFYFSGTAMNYDLSKSN